MRMLPFFNFSENCGTRVFENEILGSETNGHWPWMASVGSHDNNNWKHVCGATLITESHFLTSAHCAKTG